MTHSCVKEKKFQVSFTFTHPQRIPSKPHLDGWLPNSSSTLRAQWPLHWWLLALNSLVFHHICWEQECSRVYYQVLSLRLRYVIAFYRLLFIHYYASKNFCSACMYKIITQVCIVVHYNVHLWAWSSALFIINIEKSQNSFVLKWFQTKAVSPSYVSRSGWPIHTKFERTTTYLTPWMDPGAKHRGLLFRRVKNELVT